MINFKSFHILNFPEKYHFVSQFCDGDQELIVYKRYSKREWIYYIQLLRTFNLLRQNGYYIIDKKGNKPTKQIKSKNNDRYYKASYRFN